MLTLSGYYTQGGQRLLDIVWEERFAVRENETEVFVTQTATARADVALPSVGTAPSLIVTGHASMWKSATSHDADSVVISAPAAEIGAAQVDTVADTVVPVDTLGSVGFDTVSATSYAASAANVVIRVAGQRLLQSGS